VIFNGQFKVNTVNITYHCSNTTVKSQHDLWTWGTTYWFIPTRCWPLPRRHMKST